MKKFSCLCLFQWKTGAKRRRPVSFLQNKDLSILSHKKALTGRMTRKGSGFLHTGLHNYLWKTMWIMWITLVEHGVSPPTLSLFCDLAFSIEGERQAAEASQYEVIRVRKWSKRCRRAAALQCAGPQTPAMLDRGAASQSKRLRMARAAWTPEAPAWARPRVTPAPSPAAKKLGIAVSSSGVS